MNTCIIGGGGFIGRYVVQQLADTGRNIMVIGRKPESPFDPSIKYLSNRNNDPSFFYDAFQGMDEVIELAYSTTPQTSFENPVRDIIENLEVSVKIFESLIKAQVKKVVYVSSGGTVYGHAKELPIREDHPTNPVSPYGITKLATEKYGLLYHLTNALPIVLVRPANAYGIGQMPYLGQGFVSTAIAAIINDKPLTIFGREGTTRDYIYVEDVAKGIVAALEFGRAGECYNIGTGTGYSNLQIIEHIRQQLGLATDKIKLNFQPSRSFDVQSNVLESAKLTGVSGWRSAISLADGLKKTTRWLQQLPAGTLTR